MRHRHPPRAYPEPVEGSGSNTLRQAQGERGWILVVLALFLAAPLLSSCGLRPLYGNANSASAQTLGAVEVGEIPGRAGYLMRGALQARLGAVVQQEPRYRLEVVLDDQITGFGVRADNAVTRERRALRARFQLVTADRGTVLLDDTAGSDSGIDVVSSEYATIAAENTALERLTEIVADEIVARIALYAQRRADQQELELETEAVQ